MNTQAINSAAFTAVKGYSTATTEGDKKKGAHLDAMFKNEMRAPHTISPEGKDSADSWSTPEQYAAIKGNVLTGFAQKDQALFKVEVKTLSDDDKARKRWVTQQIGSRIKDIRKGLLSRAIDAGEIEPEQRETKTEVEKIIAAIKTAANTARKDETPEYSPSALITSLAQTMALVGTDDDIRSIIEG
jgi:hypothetical protein